MENNGERIWDYTSISTFQTCPKKFYYRMIKDLTPLTTAPALLFGKALHMALETYYNNTENRLEKAIEAFKANYVDSESDAKRTTANAEKLLRGYAEVYANEPFKVLSTEVGFSVPVEYGSGKSFLLCGRLDALVDWQGALYVLEHKSTTMLASNYFFQFEMNMQVDGYIYAATQITGRRCLGAIINAMEVWKNVQKPTAKTKQLSDHYARDPQSRSEHQLKEYCEDLGLVVEDIIKAEKLNRFPRNKQSCFNYNYKCPYWDICKYGEDERLIEKNFRKERWEPYKQVEGGENANRVK